MLDRRLNLLDTMFLISAIAIGLALARYWQAHPGYASSTLSVRSASETIDLLLLPVSPALIALRLRQPRPRWRRMARQPGFQANLVICLATASELLNIRWGGGTEWLIIPLEIGLAQTTMVGPMLAAGWILTALAGSRRPDPDMIDRLGRAVGWAWVIQWITLCTLDESSLPRIWLGFASMLASWEV